MTGHGQHCRRDPDTRPGTLTFPIMKRLCGPGLVVDDAACLRAMALAFSRLKIVIEPAAPQRWPRRCFSVNGWTATR